MMASKDMAMLYGSKVSDETYFCLVATYVLGLSGVPLDPKLRYDL